MRIAWYRKRDCPIKFIDRDIKQAESDWTIARTYQELSQGETEIIRLKKIKEKLLIERG